MKATNYLVAGVLTLTLFSQPVIKSEIVVRSDYKLTLEAYVIRSDNFNRILPGDSRDNIERQRIQEEYKRNSRNTIPRGDNPDLQYVKDLIIRYFPEEPEVALAVAEAESGFNPRADNGRCVGVLQIMLFPDRPTREELYDAETNIAYARKMYLKQSWSPWTAYTSGKYKEYLN